MTGGVSQERGAVLWDFLTTFVSARHICLSIYRRYERRVLGAARQRGVDRTELVLPPTELWKLFHQRRLQLLRDERLAPLRDLAQRIFGESGDEGLMDAYCGHIYHEISILSEEHRSVGRFVRHHDPRRYRALFEEVSGYYPMRLRRVRRFFTAAMRRLDELLPHWSRRRVVVRSLYLFGEPLARKAYGEGREAFYRRMYPHGGVIRGYVEAGRSFYDSGFVEQARDAVHDALTASAERQATRELRSDEHKAVEELEDLTRKLMVGPPEELQSPPASPARTE